MTFLTNNALYAALHDVDAPMSRVDVDLITSPLSRTFDLFSAEGWLDLSARVEVSVPALKAQYPREAASLAMRAANVVGFAAQRQVVLPAMHRAFRSWYEENKRAPELPAAPVAQPEPDQKMGRPRKVSAVDVARLFSAGCDYEDVAHALGASASAVRKVASSAKLKPLGRKERLALRHSIGFTSWLRTEYQQGRILEEEAWRILSCRGEPDRTGGLIAALDRLDAREAPAEAEAIVSVR